MQRKQVCCLLLCFVLLFSGVFSRFMPSMTISAESTIGWVNGSDVNIRSGPSTGTASLGHVSYVTVEILGSVAGADSYTWYHIQYSSIVGYIRGDYITIIPPAGDNVDFETQLAAFPEDYKVPLRALHEQHPNWSFTADYLSVDFNDAVDHETVWPKKLVNMTADGVSWRSMGEGAYNWSTGIWNTTAGGWTGAARQVVAYYMDPRNFLDSSSIFMFARQSYDPATQNEDGVRMIAAGTFLERGYSDPNDPDYGGSYINVIMEAARQSGVSPYVIAATLRLEQGVNGTSDLISGKYGYYNFFNYGASGSDVVGNGIAYARSKGWSTRSASIIGGAREYANGYINVGQDTYYYKDFNVNTANLYGHQYAQSVYDARSSGRQLREIYASNPLAALTFRIPVYRNMPETPPAIPVENGYLNNYYFTALSSSTGISPAFSMYTTRYTMNAQGDVTVSVKVPDGAAYAGAASYALTPGVNTVTLPVRAQTGYTNSYTLTVNAASAGTLTVLIGDLPPSTVMRGDTNGDGKISISDLANIQKHLLGVSTLTGDNYLGADTNGDGRISISDFANVQKHLLGVSLLN